MPLVPRHGSRVVRGPGDSGGDEPAFREREGRPGGTARPRRHLHGGSAGRHRARRLADDVFATPEGLPFLAGTYFPGRARHGLPSFRQVLDAVIEAWIQRRHDVAGQARALSGAVASRLGPPEPSIAGGQAPRPADELSGEAAERLSAMFDPRDGGFGSAPKFPQPLLLDLLLRDHLRNRAGASLDIVERTLTAIASGGIYDHLGGGFARYSVDSHWEVPHFEKMLYDQALIARVYLHAWQLDGDPRWLQVLAETISYVLRDLRDKAGALYTAQDADSEGEEGRYYLWSAEELTSLLGPALGAEAAAWYGVTAEGNCEGRTVLHRARRGDLLRPPHIETARAKLLFARSGRVRPGLDDKIITEWNAMMCSTLAEAAAATGGRLGEGSRGDRDVSARASAGCGRASAALLVPRARRSTRLRRGLCVVDRLLHPPRRALGRSSLDDGGRDCRSAAARAVHRRRERRPLHNWERRGTACRKTS